MATNARESSPLVDAETETITRPTTATGPSRQVLTARGTGTLRTEAITNDGHAREWRAVTNEFEEYIMTEAAAADTWAAEKGVRPTSHRFTPDKARQKTGRIYGGLRFVRNNTPDALSLKTVLVTREGWPYDDTGQPAPPADFLAGLQQGRRAAHKELRTILDGHPDVRTWGRVTVLEAHESRRSGYPHAHDGIAVVGDVTDTELQPVVDAAVDGNPFARPEDHGTGALTVWDVEERDNAIERLGAELTNNLIGYEFNRDGGSPLTNVSDAHRRFATLLWATGRQTVTFGDTFREWVTLSQADWTPDQEDVGSRTSVGDFEGSGGGPDRDEPNPIDVSYTFPDEECGADEG